MALRSLLTLAQTPSRDITLPGLWFNQAPDVQGNLSTLLCNLIHDELLPLQSPDVDYTRPLSMSLGHDGGKWCARAVTYGMLIRAATAYGGEQGTFIRALFMLPYLKRLGIEALYLLPVSRTGEAHRKGTLGCPYAVANPEQLEPSLGDPAFSDVDLQFAALVEACHTLGIRVLLDFIPRTAARDSLWILQHPEWFYWIKAEDEGQYAAPKEESWEDDLTLENQTDLYELPQVQAHLKAFVSHPGNLPGWEEFASNPPKDWFGELRRRFGVTTAPGFSDWVMDPQPPWSDVTFLRLYLDHPRQAPVPAEHPPYILFDVIKANRFAGDVPNIPLRERLAGMIPGYQKRYGIDGARIDMGHALPESLERKILDAVRDYDPSFGLVAEEYNLGMAPRHKEAGYNLLIGNAWWMEWREEKIQELCHELLPPLALPIWGTAETSDTPRAAARQGEKQAIARLILNHFLPNSAPFIHSGAELLEAVPLNMGLDTAEVPYEGPLGFFDPVSHDWGRPEGAELAALIGRLSRIRDYYQKLIVRRRFEALPGDGLVRFAYRDGERALMVAMNPGREILDVLPSRRWQILVGPRDGVLGSGEALVAVLDPSLNCEIV